jgi:hypothetical protein
LLSVGHDGANPHDAKERHQHDCEHNRQQPAVVRPVQLLYQHVPTPFKVVCAVDGHENGDGHHNERQQPHDDGVGGELAAPVLVCSPRHACGGREGSGGAMWGKGAAASLTEEGGANRAGGNRHVHPMQHSAFVCEEGLRLGPPQTGVSRSHSVFLRRLKGI